MAKITRVEFTYKKPNTRYDPETGKYIGYKIYVRVGGVRYREGGFGTRQAAQDYIDALKERHKYISKGLKAPKKRVNVSLKQLVDARLKEFENDRQRHALASRVFNDLLNISGPAARVTDVTYQHLKAFNKKRQSETTNRGTPVADSTIDREMTEISSMLKDAGEYFPSLEDFAPPKIPRLQLEDNRRTRTYADSEMIALVNYYGRPRQPNESDRQYFDRVTIGHGLEFAWLTSSRRKEVVRLKKKTDYFPEQDMLRIVRWKTKKTKKDSVSIFQPVPKRVRELLELRMQLDPEGEYFFSRDGQDSQGYLKSLKLACKNLGIPYGRFTEGGLIFHDTRHTFVTTLLEEGVDLETARDLSGLSRETILIYAHSTPQSKRNAVDVINRRHRQREASKNGKKPPK